MPTSREVHGYLSMERVESEPCGVEIPSFLMISSSSVKGRCSQRLNDPPPPSERARARRPNRTSGISHAREGKQTPARISDDENLFKG